jgi:16S rRNA (guanine527-N7)-methyltransferase
MWSWLTPPIAIPRAKKNNAGAIFHLRRTRCPSTGSFFWAGTLFHVERHQLWLEIAESSPFPVPDTFVDRLEVYRRWLIDEAMVAGGIGPGEADRVDIRHVADSLLFSLVMEPAGEVLDVGTGVGLPGVPLAILAPGTHFTLLDRSRRRIDLVRRVCRILQLDNVEVVERDITGYTGSFATVVARASMPPEELLGSLSTLVSPNGVAVLGGSWAEEPIVAGYVTKEIGSAFLDRSVWILMMRQT